MISNPRRDARPTHSWHLAIFAVTLVAVSGCSRKEGGQASSSRVGTATEKELQVIIRAHRDQMPVPPRIAVDERATTAERELAGDRSPAMFQYRQALSQWEAVWTSMAETKARELGLGLQWDCSVVDVIDPFVICGAGPNSKYRYLAHEFQGEKCLKNYRTRDDHFLRGDFVQFKAKRMGFIDAQARQIPAGASALVASAPGAADGVVWIECADPLDEERDQKKREIACSLVPRVKKCFETINLRKRAMDPAVACYCNSFSSFNFTFANNKIEQWGWDSAHPPCGGKEMTDFQECFEKALGNKTVDFPFAVGGQTSVPVETGIKLDERKLSSFCPAVRDKYLRMPVERMCPETASNKAEN